MVEISKDELEKFANDASNEINLGECDSNTLGVYEKYQGVICCGTALYSNIKTKSSRTVNGHFWNVIPNHETDEKQIIDIYNYKSGREGNYSAHDGEMIYIEYFKKLTGL